MDAIADVWRLSFAVASWFGYFGAVGYDHRLRHRVCGHNGLQLSEPVRVDDDNFSFWGRYHNSDGICFSWNFYLGE
jgi:hypothetical protein